MLRLENGESGELIAALTKQTLTFIGSTGEGDSSPNYTSTSIVADGDSLVTAISKLDTSLGTYGDHGSLTGLGDDDHPQYGAVAQNEEISGQWYFDQSLGIGISAPAAYGSGGTPKIVQIQSTDYSILNLSSNDTTNGEVMGPVIGVSSGLSGADKRIGYVSFTKTSASTADPTGKIGFGTANGGSPSTKMELSAVGTLTLYGSILWQDATADVYHLMDRGSSSDVALAQFATAGTIQWQVGLTSSANYIIYNDVIDATSILIASATNFFTFNSDYILQDGTDNAQYVLDRGSTTYNSILEHATAGTVKWLSGMITGDNNYVIYNQNTTTEIITIDTTSNEFQFNTTVLLPSNDPPDENCSYRESTAKLWLSYIDDSGSVSHSWNISSVGDDDGDGFYSVSIDRNFASGFSFAPFGCSSNTTPTAYYVNVGSDGFGTALEVTVYDATGAAVDGDFSVLAFGDQ